MRPCLNLDVIVHQATKRATHCSELLQRALGAHEPGDRLIYCGTVVIDLANLWHQFCRCYYLSAAYGGRRDGFGRLIESRLNYQTAIDNALKATEPVKWNRQATNPRFAGWVPRDEPDWKVRKNFQGALLSLAPLNSTAITAGLAVQSRGFDYLPVFRNFFAHTGQSAGVAVHNVVIDLRTRLSLSKPLRAGGGSEAVRILMSYPAGSGVTLIERWLSDVENSLSFF
jgi:hypothetical protein